MVTTLPKVIADLELALASAVSVGATTATLNSATDNNDVALPSGFYAFTIDGDNSAKEFITCQLVSTALTDVKSITVQGASSTGFVNYHRVGAVVTITDWVVLGRQNNLLDGTTGFDSGFPLKYDAQPSLSDPLAIPTVQYVLDEVNGGPVSINATVIAGDAGETVADGEWVYYNTTDGEWYKTDADDTTKCLNVQIGKARGAGTNGNPISGGIFISGLETVGTYVAGTTYYIGNTAGALSTSAGTNSVVVGVGDANGDLVLRNATPSMVDAQQGGSTFGSPSNSNKFITEEKLLVTESFGTGVDGNVTISGTTTLAADMNYNNLVVTGTLITNGYVVYVKNTISGSGTVKHSEPSSGTGGAGGATTKAGGGSGAGGGIVVIIAAVWGGTFAIQSIGSDGGAGGSAGTGTGSAGTAGTVRGSGVFTGPAGQAGAAGTGLGTSGTAGTAGSTVATISLATSNGAAGGKGGGTDSDGVGNQAGGAGGTYTSPAIGITLYKFLATSLLGIDATGLLKKLSALPGSGSGASGGYDASPSQQAGGGGGGGGNGGFAVVIYKLKTWTGTSSFLGGTGGAAGTGGTNTAPAAGSNGATGSLIELNWGNLI